MRTLTTIATLNVGYGVELKELKGQYSSEYIVTYGQSVTNCGTFKQAWDEFQSKCAHCLESESYLERFED